VKSDSGEFYGYDAVFHREIKDGHKWATRVANILNEQRILCHPTPLEVAETKADVSRFSQEQDVILDSQPGWLEIKSRDLKFTEDPASFPYPTAFVDTCRGWDIKEPKPIAVVLISKKTGAKLVVSTKSQSQWNQKASFDTKRKISDTWYVVERSLLRPFSELVAFLQQRQERHQHQ
jgi:hypothetical protein